MKKMILFLFCISLILCPFAGLTAAAEALPTLSVTSVTAKPGKTVSVDICVANNPGVVSMTLTVGFDMQALTLIGVEDGRLLGAQAHKPELRSPYTLAWVNDTALTNFIGNGVLATLTFTVNESAEEGRAYPVTISYDRDNYDIYDKDVVRIDFALTNGSVNVAASTPPADLDGDGRVSAVDLVVCRVTLLTTGSADINGDGNTDILDFIRLKMILAEQTMTASDLDGDGRINYTDVSRMQAVLGTDEEVDINNDGTTDILDLIFLKRMVEEQTMTAADLDGDGKIDQEDYSSLQEVLATDGEADINNDGDTNILDLIFVKKLLEKQAIVAADLDGDDLVTQEDVSYLQDVLAVGGQADLNGDGATDILDLIYLKGLAA